MPLIRFWSGLVLLLPLIIVPLVVVWAYQAWVIRFGPLLGALDGILLVLAGCAVLFAIGRTLRRALWREPIADAQFLLPLVIYAATSFDRVRGSAARVAIIHG